MVVFRANSVLHTQLGAEGIKFVEFALGAIQRILPHVSVSAWKQGDWERSGAVWEDSSRREIHFTVSFGPKSESAKSLSCQISRRAVDKNSALRTLDTREHDICKRIALRISETVQPLGDGNTGVANFGSLQAIRTSFDESVIAEHISQHHDLKMAVSPIFSMLHTLSQQTYENKSLVFGCVLDPKDKSAPVCAFPENFMKAKKYKALSDGFRTAYRVSTRGKVVDLWDIQNAGRKSSKGKHYFPDWSAPIAQVSKGQRCGIALTRQGDILVFDKGALRFTYRYGHWQYWNHAHVVQLLAGRARAQKVPPKIVGNVVGATYRAALDVSFRRSGGLFVVLHNRKHLDSVVREGDAIADATRSEVDHEFDDVVAAHKMQSLPRAVAVDLASLGGAVVMENSGKILAYGAVLQPKRKGHLQGTEGSRTKAAIGASNYGLAVKISSDGDISVYYNGREFYPG